tara:strand:+ start:974 stop:2137 length:1164 start_codon:yes stop_codon:yes gene_type:complete
MNTKLFTKVKICDYCNNKLTFSYRPVMTRRNNLTYQCEKCNLLQSIPQKKYAQRPPPSMSSNADRSSVKYSKGLALKKHINFFSKNKIKFSNKQKILDIGSNREYFINYLHSLNIKPEITAIETDKSLLDEYKKRKNVIKINKRIELCDIKENYYDFIYFSHTLEHVSSCSLVLEKLFKCLKHDGQAFVAVPNINNFKYDNFEEIFIDPHTYHFTNNSLLKFFEKHNFKVLYKNTKDNEIQYLITKNFKVDTSLRKYFSKNKVCFDKRMYLKRYNKILTSNRKKIKIVCKKLSKIYKNDIIFWGAGRYFDAFIRIGKLDKKIITCVFDAHLYKYFTKMHNIRLFKPTFKKEWKNHKIFVSSREYQKEIIMQAKKIGYKRFIKYGEFF